MSSASSEEDISIHLTQSTLGKYVTKPNLSDKLLRKPPFRFLHDIVCVVINDNGYLKGLFSDCELVSANVKERDAKVAFLNKLISAVKSTTKIDLKARASKIIAGLEPIETNKLLQAIAKAIADKVDSTDYINSSSGAHKEKSNKPSKISNSKVKETRSDPKSKISSKTDESKSKPKLVSKEPPSSSNRLSSKTSVPEKKPREKKTLEKKSSKDSIPSTDRKKQKTNKDEAILKVSSSKIDTPKEKRSKTIETIKEIPLTIEPLQRIEDIIQDTKEYLNNDNSSESKTKLPLQNDTSDNAKDRITAEIKPVIERPKTAKISKKITEIIKDSEPIANQDSIETKSLDNQEPIPTTEQTIPNRPPTAIISAKPSSTRPRSTLRPPSARPGTARPAAPRLRPPSALPPTDSANTNAIAGNVKVVVEQYKGGKEEEEDDEEETVIVQQNLEDSPLSITNTTDNTAATAASSKSHLVGQIMAQVGQEGTVRGSTQVQVQLYQDKPVAELGASIQTVTQSASTLGQLMGYLHEDIDAMRTELEQWSQIARATMGAADKRRTELAEHARPLRDKLQEVEHEIQRQKEEITTLQCNIHSDQARIATLLRREVEGVAEAVALPIFE